MPDIDTDRTVTARIIDHDRIVVVGGWPGGKCDIHRLIVSWPGWRRIGREDQFSRFEAPAIASCLAPLLTCKTLKVRWDYFLHLNLALSQVQGVAQAKIALSEPPTRLLFEKGFLRQPMPHQLQAELAFVKLGGTALLADDMGLGKTTTSLICFHQSTARRALVLCPTSAKHNWKREIAACLGDTDEVPVFLVDGTRKQRLKEIAGMSRSMKEEDERRMIAVINYDMLPHLREEDADILSRWAYNQFLICDESHYLKARTAKRTKFVMERLNQAWFRLLMTGTPVRNTIEDLWSQVEILRPGTWTSFHDFARRHLVMAPMKVGKRTFQMPRGSKNLPALNAVMNTLQIKRAKSDVLDLPPKIRTKVELEMDPGSRRIYEVMKEMAVFELAKLGEEVPIFKPQAKSAVEAAMRCEQIAQGFIGGLPPEYLEKVAPLVAKYCEKVPGRPGDLVLSKSTKLQWVVEAIETVLGQGGAPVVFSRFNTPLFWLHSKYQDFGLVHGGVTAKDRDQIFQEFKEGKLAGILCQVRIAEAFNLTRSQDVTFIGRDHAPSVNVQAEDRTYRIGQTGTVNVQIPIVLKSVEEFIDRKLESKTADAENALRNVTIKELTEAL